jgi:hypothetical protein
MKTCGFNNNAPYVLLAELTVEACLKVDNFLAGNFFPDLLSLEIKLFKWRRTCYKDWVIFKKNR